MMASLRMIGLTGLLLAVLDITVALGLGAMDRMGVGQGLVQYFEYGRSVPGKLTQWIEHPHARGNLFSVAWIPETLAASSAGFAAEAEADGTDLTIRGYGMSFSNNILSQVQEQDQGIALDHHGGPAAPPNFVYELFLEDRSNRREGDVVAFAILSSSVSAMHAMSNRTWNFEQPAPVTYPIFHPDETAANGLRRVAPLVTNEADERALSDDPDARAAWQAQLAAEDAFYTAPGFAAPWLDYSPFMRLVRRAAAVRAIDDEQARVLSGDTYDYARVLRRMIEDTARITREDGQTPLILLIQGRDPRDPDLLEIAQDTLTTHRIAYLATVDHFDPGDTSGFLPDGHYRSEVDGLFAAAVLDILENHAAPN